METTDAIKSLGALAQETRLAIYRLLVQAGPEGRAAGVIGEQLGIPPATLSFHLAQLAGAGLEASLRITVGSRVENDRLLAALERS